MKRNKGFVVSAVLYPLLILFLALMMGLLSVSDTRKRILDRMKLEITDSIFNEATCSCDTILNKLNYIIQNGKYCSDSNIGNLRITAYDTYEEIPKNGNTDNDIAVVTTVPIEGYVLSATKPKRDTEGELWIFVDETAPNSIDTTYSNVPIAYIKQYIGGKWTTLVSAIYDGTMWKQLNYTELETATPATIVSGKTANVNGQRITGTLNTGASYFEIDVADYTTKLRNREITFGRQKRVTTHEYDTLYAYWENDTGAKIELPIKIAASTYAIDSVNTTNEILDWFQVSDKVVAAVIKRTVDYDKSNFTSTVYDYNVYKTFNLYVATFTATATTLTQVGGVSYNVSPRNNDGTGITYLNNDYWIRRYSSAANAANFDNGIYVTSYIQRYMYDIDWKYSSDKKLKLSLTELQMPYNNMFVTAALAKNIQESENIFDLSNIIPDGEKYKIMYSPYVSYETGEIYAVLEFESGSKLYLILTLTDDNKCFAEAKACLSPSISFASWKENEYKGKEFSSKRLLLTNGQSIYQQEQIINFYR